jgi:hypothetical protein
MRQIAKAQTVIKQLNKRFKGLKAVDGSEWTGNVEDNDYIWLKGMYEQEETVHSPWGSIECMEPSPMNEFLQARGWFMEPYDSMTVMAYKI